MATEKLRYSPHPLPLFWTSRNLSCCHLKLATFVPYNNRLVVNQCRSHGGQVNIPCCYDVEGMNMHCLPKFAAPFNPSKSPLSSPPVVSHAGLWTMAALLPVRRAPVPCHHQPTITPSSFSTSPPRKPLVALFTKTRLP